MSICKNNTEIWEQINGAGFISVKLHRTTVVEFNDSIVRLWHGGWKTATTKARMNQASDHYGLGFRVFQDKKVWYVSLPNGETVPFTDPEHTFSR